MRPETQTEEGGLMISSDSPRRDGARARNIQLNLIGFPSPCQSFSKSTS